MFSTSRILLGEEPARRDTPVPNRVSCERWSERDGEAEMEGRAVTSSPPSCC